MKANMQSSMIVALLLMAVLGAFFVLPGTVVTKATGFSNKDYIKQLSVSVDQVVDVNEPIYFDVLMLNELMNYNYYMWYGGEVLIDGKHHENIPINFVPLRGVPERKAFIVGNISNNLSEGLHDITIKLGFVRPIFYKSNAECYKCGGYLCNTSSKSNVGIEERYSLSYYVYVLDNHIFSDNFICSTVGDPPSGSSRTTVGWGHIIKSQNYVFDEQRWETTYIYTGEIYVKKANTSGSVIPAPEPIHEQTLFEKLIEFINNLFKKIMVIK